MVALISSLLTIIAMILEVVVQQRQAREAKTYANDIPKFDKALDERDADSLSAQFDELRVPGPTGPGDLGRPDNQGTP